MNFKGIIFDLDGTLVNSIEDIADSMNTVLKQHYFPTHDIKTYQQLLGNGLKNLVSVSLPKNSRDDKLINSCLNLMIELYRNNCTNKTKPYNGIINLLDILVSHQLKIAILSNKADELTKKIVLNLFPNYNFDFVSGLIDEATKKPNPSVALQISKKLNIPPNQIIFVGDSSVDIKTATNAGMYAVGVTWGYRTKEELTANGANYILNHPLDLTNIL